MADRSVVARSESHGSEVSEALMFCFDGKVLVVDLVYFVSPSIIVFVFVNAT